MKAKTDFNKFWEQFKKSADPAPLLAAVNEAKQRSIDASAAAKAAEKNYFANVERKKEKVSSRIAELNGRRSAIETQYDALKYPLTTAMANEDTEELAKIRSDMKSLEAEKARVASEIELLQNVCVRGDDDLYMAVKAKHDHYLEQKKAAQEIMQTVHEYDFVKRYTEIADHCYYWSDYSIGTSVGSGADMEMVDKNYHAEDHAKRMSGERERIAGEAARRQSRGLVTVTQNIRDTDAKAAPGYNPDNGESGSYFAKLSHGISEGYSGPALREAMQRSGEPSHSGQRGAETSGSAPLRPPAPVVQYGAKAETVQTRQPRKGFGAFFKR